MFRVLYPVYRSVIPITRSPLYVLQRIALAAVMSLNSVLFHRKDMPITSYVIHQVFRQLREIVEYQYAIQTVR